MEAATRLKFSWYILLLLESVILARDYIFENLVCCRKFEFLEYNKSMAMVKVVMTGGHAATTAIGKTWTPVTAVGRRLGSSGAGPATTERR